MPDRPLLITSDPDVLDDLVRIGLTAGTELQVAPDVGTARRSWAAAVLQEELDGAVHRQAGGAASGRCFGATQPSSAAQPPQNAPAPSGNIRISLDSRPYASPRS